MLEQTHSPNHRRRRHCRSIIMAVIVVPLLVITLLLSVAVLRAVLLRPSQSHVLPSNQVIDMIDTSASRKRAERLAGALRIQTVSYDPGNQEFQELIRMREYLETSFPLVHKSSFISREVINEYSLLYTVQGTSRVNTTLPYLLAAHLDVVSANPATWEVPPFSGDIVNDTFIYGRGAMDDKACVMAILESLEYMLQNGERPKRSFYIALGHDEEVLGLSGARMIAKTLNEKCVDKFDFVVDEGMPLTNGVIPGAGQLISLIGVSEKGYLTLDLSVSGNPGHSSIPPSESSLGILAGAVYRLEQNPFPSMFGTGPEKRMFVDVAPYCSFFYRLLYCNLWLFSGLMTRLMSMKPITNAIIRTTTAVIKIHSGDKDNVVPQTAEAVVNFRIHPSQSVDDVVAIAHSIIADPRVIIRRRDSIAAIEPHPISPSGVGDVPYQLMASTIRQIYTNAVVVPATLIGNTDTRYYLPFTKHVFRIFPFVMTSEDASRLHGNNERITIENYQNSVNFYYRLMKNADLLVDYEQRVVQDRGTEL